LPFAKGVRLSSLHVAEANGGSTEGQDADVARPVLRLFAAARLAAGTGRVVIPGGTVGVVLDAASAAYGAEFVSVLAGSRVWLNGEPAQRDVVVRDGDEIAVLPPVSGGA
jgi:molybdopterin synthase sulfur carrier subunit